MNSSFRRQARQTAMSMLFQMDVGNNDWQQAELTLADADLTTKARAFARELASGVVEKQADIDAMLAKYSADWDIDRMPAIDRSLLRLAVYEFSAYPDTPVAVVINEAIEIAKAYSTDESGAFINGILDKIYGDIYLSRPSDDAPDK